MPTLDALTAGGLPARLGGRGERGFPRLGGESKRLGLAVLAAAMVVFFELTSGGFATIDNFETILLNSSALLTVGIFSAALVISGNVDLSIGGMYGLLAVVTAVVVRETGNVVLGVVAGPVLGLCLGWLNGRLVRLLRISPLIVTLGALGIYRGLAYILADNGGAVFGFPEGFTAIGQTYIFGFALPVWVAAAAFAVAAAILMRTVAGVRTFAIGGNAEAVRQNGVNVERHVTTLFALNGLAVGLVAMLAAAQLGSASGDIGLNFELDVLTAVILGGVAFSGGTGRPIGIAIGILTIGILNAGMIFIGLQDFHQQIAKGAVLLLALGADQVVERRRGTRGRRQPMAKREATSREEPALAPISRPEGPGQNGKIVLECEGLSKRYGGVWAVRDVSLTVRSGEVLCLLGDNGAGKSTVVKAITGVVGLDEGTLKVNGDPLSTGSPAAARDAGVEAVFQDLALCPNLGAALNLALGAEPRRLQIGPLSPVNFVQAERVASERLERLGITLNDYYRPVGSLSGGQRQSVAIGRVARGDVSLAILDEPTAALGVAQTHRTLELVRALAAQGAGVIVITHDIESVFAVADRIVVLRQGEVVFDGAPAATDESGLLHLMAGFSIESNRVALAHGRPGVG